MSDIKQAVQQYLSEGVVCLPVKRGEKATRFPNWPTARPTLEDFAEENNVAQRLDPPVAEADCDSPETRAIAPYLLLKTHRIHGRPSVGPSHYWYVSPEARAKVFKDIDESVLIELRAGNKQYTLIPPSVLPRKDDPANTETLVWDRNGAPGKVDPEGLFGAIRLVAVAAILARHWPSSQRHDATLAIAGTLATLGVVADDAQRVLECVTRYAEGQVWADCASSVRSTYAARKDGKPYKAATELKALLGDKGEAVVKRIRAWFGGSTALHAELIEKYNGRFCRVLAGSTNAKNFVIDESVIDRVQLYTIPEFLRVQSKDTPVPVKFDKDGNATAYKPAAAFWLDHPKGRQAGLLEVAPPPLVCAPSVYNLWRDGFAVSPEPRSWDRLRDHLRVIICDKNEDHFQWVMNWLRCLVQLPGELPGSALVWRGARAAGKGTMARAIKDLFHPRHAAQIFGRKQLTGHFNAHQAGKVLLYGDEGVWSASGEEDRALLQGLITEPVIPVEAKGVDLTFVRNVCHLIMVTNDAWAAPAGAFERRFMVQTVNPFYTLATREQKNAYFGALHAEIANGGLAGMLHALLNEDKADLDLARNPPRTEGLWQQFMHGLAAPERWWLEILIEGELPPGASWGGIVSREALTASYMSALQLAGDKRRFWAQELAQLLRRVMPSGFPKIGPRREKGRTWLFPSLEACRQTFLDVHGFGHLKVFNPLEGVGDDEQNGDIPF